MAGDDTNGILRDIQLQVQDCRERLIRIETHGFPERLKDTEDEVDSLRDRLTVLETQGRFFSAGVSAGVAVVVSVVGTALTYFIGR